MINDSSGGRIYIFRLGAGSFLLEQEIAVPLADYGRSLGIDGDLLVVGATEADAPGCPQDGAAFLFRFDGRLWKEEAVLHGIDCQPGSNLFGGASATSNGVVLVGDHLHDGPLTNTGAVFVFRHVNDQWVFEQMLKPSDVVPGAGKDSSRGHRFGHSIALDAAGSTAIIGAPTNRVNGLNQAGSAYVFEHDGSQWVETAKLTANPPSAFAEFGSSVAISEDGLTIIVGETFFGQFLIGHFFRRIGNEWVEVLTFPGVGTAIDIQGDLAAVSGGLQGHVFAGISDIDCNNNGIPDGCDIALGTSADANNDGVPDECQALPDLTGNGIVDVFDLLALLSAWGPCPEPDPSPLDCPADLNGDGVVDVFDLLDLLAAWGPMIPPPICPASEGGCCVAHGGAGCADVTCCDNVCAADPFCCTTRWDIICVHAARELCDCAPPAACGGTETGTCCTPGGGSNGSPGCDDAACCQWICDHVDPFCCDAEWDATCTDWAFLFCEACPPAVCAPDAGTCCAPNGSAGCEDVDCCAQVCANDFFCCFVIWDGICSSQANNLCAVCNDDG